MATYYNENTVLYLNGKYVKASEAKMDFYSQSLHYGMQCLKGSALIRQLAEKRKFLNLFDHYERLKNSALAMNMPYVWEYSRAYRYNL